MPVVHHLYLPTTFSNKNHRTLQKCFVLLPFSLLLASNWPAKTTLVLMLCVRTRRFVNGFELVEVNLQVVAIQNFTNGGTSQMNRALILALKILSKEDRGAVSCHNDK